MSKSKAISLAMQMAMFAGVQSRRNTLENGVERTYNPWDSISLSKAERRGKTYEQMQKLRKNKWENIK